MGYPSAHLTSHGEWNYRLDNPGNTEHVHSSFSLSELVKDRQNGYTFKTADELARQLSDLLRGFPSAPGLSELRESYNQCMSSSNHTHPSHEHRSIRGTKGPGRVEEEETWCSWAENWNRVVKPLVLRDLEREEQLSFY